MPSPWSTSSWESFPAPSTVCPSIFCMSMEALAMLIAQPSPSNRIFSIFFEVGSTLRRTVMWSPHSGFDSSPLCVASGSGPKFRGDR